MPRISSPWGNIFCKFGKEAALCLDKTIIYTRDAGGNVTQKKVYALSTQANPCMTAGVECLILQAAWQRHWVRIIHTVIRATAMMKKPACIT